MSRDERDAVRVLHAIGHDPESVRVLMPGAWSTAFLVGSGGVDLVLRLGGRIEDYAADAFAAGLDLAEVPVPQVLDHGVQDGLTYALSEFVAGEPLEAVDSDTWTGVVPQLVDMLEALRGIGPDEPRAPDAWHHHLLDVGEYPWQRGWRERADPDAVQLFDVGRTRLGELAVDDAPMSLVHADWINRNVHVADGRITAVFDWGCSQFADHLYDVAWFEFWAPWHPNLDVAQLREELATRWNSAGIAPLDNPDRLLACLLHIGLDHIVYNVVHGSLEQLRPTMDRLEQYL
ncbi:MAG: aminoglycoside phosphotransferase family protein [Propionibacteriales bacterium]|nr:aminoglycoside phosphotransferase family protein [Propionibacteriales bacterium]